MELLDFDMPPFARIQWASRQIKDKYEPKMTMAGNLFHSLEQASVQYELRKVTTGHITHDLFDAYQKSLLKKGLFFLAIQKVGAYSGVANKHPEVVEGKPWNYYGVIARTTEDAEAFAHAGEIGDHLTQGALLGYPSCCTHAFSDRMSKRYYDPTWEQASALENEHIKEKNNNIIKVKKTPWETNNILRPFSINLMFQQGCSLCCLESLQIARSWIELAQKNKLEGLREMELFLRLPYEWDNLRGIAYIKTPLFKISTNSTPYTKKKIVQVDGTYFPEDAPTNANFPWSESMVTVARNGNLLES